MKTSEEGSTQAVHIHTQHQIHPQGRDGKDCTQQLLVCGLRGWWGGLCIDNATARGRMSRRECHQWTPNTGLHTQGNGRGRMRINVPAQGDFSRPRLRCALKVMHIPTFLVFDAWTQSPGVVVPMSPHDARDSSRTVAARPLLMQMGCI